MSFEVSLEQVREAALKAKAEVQSTDIPSNEIDLVAATKAALDLFRQYGGKATQNGHIDQISDGGFVETFAEWADKYSLETNYDRFVAAAQYLREKKQVKIVNTDTIGQMFDKARWTRPKNMADTFGKAAAKRYFAEAEANTDEHEGETLKSWMLTRTGYEYLQSLLKENQN